MAGAISYIRMPMSCVSIWSFFYGRIAARWVVRAGVIYGMGVVRRGGFFRISSVIFERVGKTAAAVELRGGNSNKLRRRLSEFSTATKSAKSWPAHGMSGVYADGANVSRCAPVARYPESSGSPLPHLDKA